MTQLTPDQQTILDEWRDPAGVPEPNWATDEELAAYDAATRDAPPPDNDEDPPQPTEPLDSAANVDEFWDARPIHRHLHQFAKARRVSDWAVLFTTLARVVVATPYVVALPPIVGAPASLNLFVALVGPSGSGKGAATAVSAEALQVGYIESQTVGSGEGIGHGYMHYNRKTGLGWNDDHHAVLFNVPEVDTLAALKDRQGSTLLAELRKAWSGEQLGFGYADPTKKLKIPAHQYRMGLIAGVQPLRAHVLLDDADGGTPQRFVWAPATDPDAPDRRPSCPQPRRWRFPAPPGGLQHPESATSWHLPVCDLARDEIDRDHLARMRGQAPDGLEAHGLLARLKIAAALALLDGHLEVREDDWHLAGILARQSTRVRARVQEALRRQAESTNRGRAEAEATRAVITAEALDDSKITRVCASIRRHLQRLPDDDRLSYNDLKKKLASRDRPFLDEALDRLTHVGQLDVHTTDRNHDGTGGKGSTFRLKETP